MKRGRDEGEMESVEMVNCLMLLSKVGETETNKPSSLERSGRCFRCKTCNKQFPSFQALGGHRASHKKPKLMLSTSHLPMKPKMHPCPICGIEFGVGQALGGHMRKHRTPNTRRSDYLCFDLNLTPSENYLNLNSITPALNCFI